MKILADHPAKTVYAIGGPLPLDNDKGYVRTMSIPVFLKAFPGDRHEYIRSFTIGVDAETGEPFAYGNGSMITAETSAKAVALGLSLGDVVEIEGKSYRIEQDHNKNIKLVSA